MPDPQTASADASPPTDRPFSPVEAEERTELLDIFRGVAVLGILLVNLGLFFAPIYTMMLKSTWVAPIDRIAKVLIVFLAEGKFYTVFSFLFGLGAAVQMGRADARGRPFAGFFARRLGWLLLIGACHAFLIWYGDILATYALLGFVLLLFFRRKNTTLLVWTIVFLLIPLVFVTGFTMLLFLGNLVPEAAEAIDNAMAESRELNQERIDEANRVYPAGGYREILPLRAQQVGTIYGYSLMVMPGILAIFLIGFNFGRRGFFQNVQTHLPRIRKLLPWLLLAGLLGSGTYTALRLTLDQMRPTPLILLQSVSSIVGNLSLCFSYLLGITLLVQRDSWHRLFRPLAAVGRMALTNYLMHSLLFTLLANGYGLGFYGRVRPSVGLLLTLATFALQILLSNWWLRRFRYGPAEWLWRSLSYGRLQPMRRSA
jgi:uncharacterized protein